MFIVCNLESSSYFKANNIKIICIKECCYVSTNHLSLHSKILLLFVFLLIGNVCAHVR